MDAIDDNIRPIALDLRWLGRLRWWAMGAASVGAVIALVLDWRFVSGPAVVAGVLVGCIINVIFTLRVHRRLQIGREELMLHIFVDLTLLTWLLAWAGGIRNPLCVLYSFHVVLAALLSGRRGAIFATGLAATYIGVLFALETFGLLPMTMTNQPPQMLWLVSLTVMLFSLGYFGIVLSSRLRHQRQLALTRQAEAVGNLQLFLSALDALQVGIEVKNPDGNMHLANKYADRLRPGQSTPVRRQDDIERYALKGESGPRIVDRVHLPASDEQPFATVLYVDRTDELLVDQRHMMLERLATLGRALQGVAHELNTPLTTMQTLAKDLAAAAKDLPIPQDAYDDMSESIQLIIEESQRCRSLTQSLLRTAHTKPAATMDPNQSALDVVSRALRLVGYDPIKCNHADSLVELDKESLEVILGADGDRVLQIIMNLTQNALRACADGAPGCVHISAFSDDDRLTIEVKDRGPGLPKSVQTRLFEPFVTTHGSGTGLGLYVSHSLAREMHGDLTLLPRAGGGTSARLSLPLAKARHITGS